MHEKSRLPHSGRTFDACVEGRKGVRLEPATLLWLRERQVDIIVRDWGTTGCEHREVTKNILSDQQTQTIPSYTELADSERLIGDEAEKQDSQESRAHRFERSQHESRTT